MSNGPNEYEITKYLQAEIVTIDSHFVDINMPAEDCTMEEFWRSQCEGQLTELDNESRAKRDFLRRFDPRVVDDVRELAHSSEAPQNRSRLLDWIYQKVDRKYNHKNSYVQNVTQQTVAQIFENVWHG